MHRSTIVNSSQTPIYDGSGDVIDDGGNSYLYDAEGHRFAKGTLTSLSCDPGVNGFSPNAAKTPCQPLKPPNPSLTNHLPMAVELCPNPYN